MNPALGVSDWITAPAMWVVLIAAVAWFAVFTIRAIKTDRLTDRYDTQPCTTHTRITYNGHSWCSQCGAEDDEQADDTCFVQVCTTPGIIPTHTVHGIRFVCRYHSGMVRYWTGDVPYDQETAPDFHAWEDER